MLCQNCGKEMPEGAKFCTGCGAKVAEIETDEIHLNAAEQLKEESSASAPVETVAAAAAKMEKRKETLREKYLSFHGRLNRKPYILRGLTLIPVYILLDMLLEYLMKNVIFFQERPIALDLFCYFFLFLCFTVINSLRLRRLHDLNQSGWLCLPIIVLVFLYPITNLGIEPWLCFMKGTEGDNKYGPDPLAK